MGYHPTTKIQICFSVSSKIVGFQPVGSCKEGGVSSQVICSKKSGFLLNISHEIPPIFLKLSLLQIPPYVRCLWTFWIAMCFICTFVQAGILSNIQKLLKFSNPKFLVTIFHKEVRMWAFSHGMAKWTPPHLCATQLLQESPTLIPPP